MARAPRRRGDGTAPDRKREEMRLFMAAAAILLLVAGPVLIAILIFRRMADPVTCTMLGSAFIVPGVILLLAAAFIVREDVKALADAGVLGGRSGGK